MYHRAFHIVKAFIQMGTENTVESLQALYVSQFCFCLLVPHVFQHEHACPCALLGRSLPCSNPAILLQPRG